MMIGPIDSPEASPPLVGERALASFGQALSPQQRVLERYLAPLRAFLADERLSEVVVNRPGEVFTEGPEGWTRHEVLALSGAHLQHLALAAAAYTRQDIAPDHPVVSTTLPGGERCQIVVPPAVPSGTVSLTIRKAACLPMTLDELERRDLFGEVKAATGTLSIEEEELLLLRDGGAWRAFLELAVRTRRNIIISGATGSGKTTLAKGLVACIPAHERILTIEDTAELTVPHANQVRLLYSKDGLGIARIGPRELLESSLRMRPDRILLQELRDGTAFYYLRNVNSGHPGSITTVHADSACLAFEQLTLLVKESAEGRELARDDIRNLLKLTVDVVVQMTRVEGRYRIRRSTMSPTLNGDWRPKLALGAAAAILVVALYLSKGIGTGPRIGFQSGPLRKRGTVLLSCSGTCPGFARRLS